jgi:hypothetical protein
MMGMFQVMLLCGDFQLQVGKSGLFWTPAALSTWCHHICRLQTMFNATRGFYLVLPLSHADEKEITLFRLRFYTTYRPIIPSR